MQDTHTHTHTHEHARTHSLTHVDVCVGAQTHTHTPCTHTHHTQTCTQRQANTCAPPTQASLVIKQSKASIFRGSHTGRVQRCFIYRTVSSIPSCHVQLADGGYCRGFALSAFSAFDRLHLVYFLVSISVRLSLSNIPFRCLSMCSSFCHVLLWVSGGAELSLAPHC